MRKPAYNAEQNDESHSFDSRNTKIETTTSQCKYIVVISEEKRKKQCCCGQLGSFHCPY
jgi:hypothetical protein